jgi:hypothetical protein
MKLSGTTSRMFKTAKKPTPKEPSPPSLGKIQGQGFRVRSIEAYTEMVLETLIYLPF